MLLEDILAEAMTKVAHKACRNGEDGKRAWPPLKDLPAPKSWESVGRQYARELMLEVAKQAFCSFRLALPSFLVRRR